MKSADAATMWSPTTAPGLLLLRANYRRQRFARHTHGEYVVGVNAAGAHSFFCRGAQHEVPGGSIALVNPEDVHTGANLGNAVWDYQGFYVDPTWLRDRWRELAGTDEAPMFRRSVVFDLELSGALAQLHCKLAQPGDPLANSSLAVAVFSQLLSRHADRQITAVPRRAARPDAAAVRVTREYLEAHYAQRITLGELCARAGIEEFRLLRTFTQAIGMPPYEYVTSVRINHARRLLAAGLSATSVAFEVGFCDQSHLMRHFKRILGVTPGTYTRALRSGTRHGAVQTSKTLPPRVDTTLA
jgi:AraC-like DNA-binding protein